MRNSRKITYAATSAAIAVICMAVSVFFPVVALAPLMVSALCLYIAFECGIFYGFAAAAVSLLTSFLWFGGVALNISFLFAAFVAVPYALTAVFIKKLDYSKPKKGLLRAGIIAVFFNIAFAVIVWVFTALWSEFLFGADLGVVFDRAGGAAAGYIVLAVLGTVFMIAYDYAFLLVVKMLNQRLRFLSSPKKNTDDAEPYDGF